ncbi:hypothetical protein BDW22DRAFT_1355086 [Trametopsis cervina]|nr:hypothetical protein BDW22DRAFT_1355086 [Trametopsis cervina]
MLSDNAAHLAVCSLAESSAAPSPPCPPCHQRCSSGYLANRLPTDERKIPSRIGLITPLILFFFYGAPNEQPLSNITRAAMRKREHDMCSSWDVSRDLKTQIQSYWALPVLIKCEGSRRRAECPETDTDTDEDEQGSI